VREEVRVEEVMAAVMGAAVRAVEREGEATVAGLEVEAIKAAREEGGGVEAKAVAVQEEVRVEVGMAVMMVAAVTEVEREGEATVEGSEVAARDSAMAEAAREVERVEAARAVVREAVGRAEATAVAVKEEVRVEAARAAVMVAAARPVAMHWYI
jgi:hypothetical protein